VDAGDNTSSSEVGGVSSKDKELRQENASLTKDVEDWKHEARHMTDLNKMLIQTNRPVFVAGDKVILRRGCKPTVSITDTKNDITTYVVECAK
jgi:hypothetical protein